MDHPESVSGVAEAMTPAEGTVRRWQTLPGGGHLRWRDAQGQDVEERIRPEQTEDTDTAERVDQLTREIEQLGPKLRRECLTRATELYAGTGASPLAVIDAAEQFSAYIRGLAPRERA